MSVDARDTALSALIAGRKKNAWSDGVLKEYIRRDGLDRRDAALASRLCYGVLQNRMLLDFYLQSFLRGKLKDLQPVVLDILRLGAYQIALCDRIPDSAAVNRAVEQTKRHANARAAGLVNGVLRNLSRAERLPDAPDLATRYSHPPELVALLREAVGEEELEALLEANNETPETCVQVNTLRGTVERAERALTDAGAQVRRHPLDASCLLVSGGGAVDQMASFRAGEIYVQDAGAHWAALAGGAAPGMRVLDACAAPGGKSFAAAIAMDDAGQVVSCDLHEHKIRLIAAGAERLGLSSVAPRAQDAGKFDPEFAEKLDLVIADVPCSGLGVIRKKPDIRYKSLAGLENLPAVQKRILDNVSRYVRPGGVLVYSTCTVLERENAAVVREFLRENAAFSLETLPVPVPEDAPGMVTLWPHRHGTDGFFICRMRRCE